MRIAVIYKWSRNNQDATVRSDGSIDWRNAKNVPGEDDSAALACAQLVAHEAGAELVGLTIGDGDASWALARGVESAVSVTGVPHFDDAAATAHALAQGIRAIDGVTHVFIGDSAQHPAVAGYLGAELGAATLLSIHEVGFDGQDILARRHGAEETEVFRVAGPALISIAAVSEETRKPGMKEMLAARKRPVVLRSAAEMGISGDDGISVEDTQVPLTQSATIFEGTTADKVQSLLAVLRNQGVLG